MESKYKVHCFYILLIFISIIVGLISVEWSKVPDLVDYITFALTLSSLILAGLAIVYSIYSNTSISGSLGQISSAASEVSSASLELKSSNKELKDEVSKIPLRLDDVDKNLSNTHRALMDFSESQELMNKSTPSEIDPSQDTNISDDRALRYLKESSVRGLELLFIVKLSYETNTSLSLFDFVKEIKDYAGSYDYLLAYKISSNAFGLISSTHDARAREMFSYVHPVILDKVESLLVEKSTGIVRSGIDYRDSTEEEMNEKVRKRIEELNKLANYFGKVVNT